MAKYLTDQSGFFSGSERDADIPTAVYLKTPYGFWSITIDDDGIITTALASGALGPWVPPWSLVEFSTNVGTMSGTGSWPLTLYVDEPDGAVYVRDLWMYDYTKSVFAVPTSSNPPTATGTYFATASFPSRPSASSDTVTYTFASGDLGDAYSGAVLVWRVPSDFPSSYILRVASGTIPSSSQVQITARPSETLGIVGTYFSIYAVDAAHPNAWSYPVVNLLSSSEDPDDGTYTVSGVLSGTNWSTATFALPAGWEGYEYIIGYVEQEPAYDHAMTVATITGVLSGSDQVYPVPAHPRLPYSIIIGPVGTSPYLGESPSYPPGTGTYWMSGTAQIDAAGSGSMVTENQVTVNVNTTGPVDISYYVYYAELAQATDWYMTATWFAGQGETAVSLSLGSHIVPSNSSLTVFDRTAGVPLDLVYPGPPMSGSAYSFQPDVTSDVAVDLSPDVASHDLVFVFGYTYNPY